MNALTGTGSLTRLALRRDRFKLPAYVVGLSLLTLGMLAGIGGQDRQALVDEAELFASTPAMRIFGVASGASEGATTMIRGYLLLAVLAALMSALSVVRHTRQNEETGRAELVGAAVVGRHAGLAAALIVTVAANVALAVAIGAAGIVAGQHALGSFTAGMATGALGIVFAGVAAVAVQLSSTTRGASGFAAAVLGLAFVVSGVGNLLGHADASGLRLVSAWPAWLSPLGWGQQMRPFGGDSWWPLSLFLVAFIVLAGAASMLATRRDLGSGILAQRRGQAEASPRLLSPFGLVWRLQRNALLGWTVAMAGFGLVFGAIIDEMKDLEGAAADWYARMGGSEHVLDAYQASVVEMAGMAVAIYAVQILLRMRAEEAEGRLESVLAASVSRPRWLLSHLLNAGLGALLLLLVFAASMGLAAGAVRGDVPAELRALIGAGLVQLPAILLIAGVVIALTGLLPRAAVALSWAALLIAILLGPLFGAATVQLPAWAQDVSPFTHTPKLPAADLAAAPVFSLIVIAAALVAAGLASLRHRNLALPT
jgi:ABC-2 type transport system permease protein